MSDAAVRWRRLEAVVQSALERPSEQRAAFLAAACDGDEELRRDADALLQHEGRADDFLRPDVGALAANAITYSPGGTPTAGEARVAIGDRIGQYEIRARLGAGGMGEVYRAFDHTLSRDVAIKLLPAIFSGDPERLARFEREARLLASLAHPHIGAIYGLERSGDLRAIVLELIDGETLEARLRRGAMPLAQALPVSVQIAEALDHAHRRGVTHRDLKPANIMLTRGGARLLDFGLAKWSAAGFVATPSAQPHRPDGVETLTLEGTILGTPHYMAPEQLEGRSVDARADVFAFGAVLYEMLSAKKAFDGGSTAAVMAAVLNTDPPFVPSSSSPAALERIIRKCLAKDPDERWQTTRDLADELKWVASTSSRLGNEPVVNLPPVVTSRRGLAAMALLAVIAMALAGWASWRVASGRITPPVDRVMRFTIQPSTLTGTQEFAISQDGSTLAYVLQQGPTRRLFVRRLDQFESTEVPGTEGAATPLFSPDGNWVAFWSRPNRQLRKVNIQTNAAPVVVADHPEDLWNGATWLDDGRIIFAWPEHGLQQVPDTGGKPFDLTVRDEQAGERDHHSPVMLPGGDTVLFTLHDNEGFHVVAETLTTHQRTRLIDAAYDADYLPTGYLSFARGSTILTVPFDVNRLQITGPELPMVESVQTSPVDGRGGYRLSTSGTLVFQHLRPIQGRTLMWVDRTGVETSLPLPARSYNNPSVSPDGTQIAFSVTHEAGRDIYVYDIATGREDRVTRVGDNQTPIWTPDGKELTYSTASKPYDRNRQLVSMPVNQSRPAEPLVSGFFGLVPAAWTKDKSYLFFSDNDTSAKGTRMFSRNASGTVTPVADGPAQEQEPDLSPDGRWLAFNVGGEVYLTSTGTPTADRQISTEGGREPKWSRAGGEIFYRSGRRMMAVTVDPATGSATGQSRALFEKQMVPWSYDAAPAGRFLMIKATADELVPQPIRVVVNWVTATVRSTSPNR
jgi:serine/threonine-protein kinase